jgi:hypothetical protein
MAKKDSSKSFGFTQEQYQQWAIESKLNPLPRRAIALGDKTVEVFALPGFKKYLGRYIYSGTSATEAAEKHNFTFTQFLRSKSPIALPHKGFELHTFSVENSNKGVEGYPSPMVSDYWLYQLSKGNLSVAPMLSALGSTSLDLLADTEFGVDRKATEYERLIRDRLFTIEAVEYNLHFYPAYYEELYRIFQMKPAKTGKPGIFAMVTRKCFYSLFPGKANDLFDERNPNRTFYNHQFLSDNGDKIFCQIMNSFLTFLRGCNPGTWDNFLVQYGNVYGEGYQLNLSIE